MCVEPYLWGIETYRQGPWILTALPLDRTYERLKHFATGHSFYFHTIFVEPYLWEIETSSCDHLTQPPKVEPYLWVIFCFCWTHCFIRILWIVSLIFKENTKKMLQLIKSWSFFVKKFWLQEVGMYLQWRRCCPREIREMLLIISVWNRMGVALMVCRFLSWRITGRLIMSR